MDKPWISTDRNRQTKREYLIRPVEPGDNAGIEAVIRAVLPEFGASGPGFATQDQETSVMYEAYSRPGTVYFVLVRDGRVAGGAGIGPLAGEDPGVCELRKMYLLPEARGLGLGRELMRRCLCAAKDAGYKRCYLETLKSMSQANKLYIKNGFELLSGPMGKTGHFGCDVWYIKKL